MWSAWLWVRRMASRRSRPTRRACWRKSGVVSMTIFFSARERSREGRRRLSRGSLEVQTRQWQPREGTPMEVPEPRTVSFIGAAHIDEYDCSWRGWSWHTSPRSVSYVRRTIMKIEEKDNAETQRTLRFAEKKQKKN